MPRGFGATRAPHELDGESDGATCARLSVFYRTVRAVCLHSLVIVVGHRQGSGRPYVARIGPHSPHRVGEGACSVEKRLRISVRRAIAISKSACNTSVPGTKQSPAYFYYRRGLPPTRIPQPLLT